MPSDILRTFIKGNSSNPLALNRLVYNKINPHETNVLVYAYPIRSKNGLYSSPVLDFKITDTVVLDCSKQFLKFRPKFYKIEGSKKLLQDMIRTNRVLSPGVYRFDFSNVHPGSLSKLGFIDVFSADRKAKSRLFVKIGENMDKRIAQIWLFLLVIFVVSFLSIGVASTYFIFKNNEGTRTKTQLLRFAFFTTIISVLTLFLFGTIRMPYFIYLTVISYTLITSYFYMQDIYFYSITPNNSTLFSSKDNKNNSLLSNNLLMKI